MDGTNGFSHIWIVYELLRYEDYHLSTLCSCMIIYEYYVNCGHTNKMKVRSSQL